MAGIFASYSAAQKGDAAVSIAVLALHDGGVAVTADNIKAVLAAAGVTVEAYWAPIFAKLLAGRNIDDMLMKPGAGGGGAPVAAAAGGAAPAAAAGGDKKAEAKKEEKKEEEEEDAGGAGGLFGGDDDDW